MEAESLVLSLFSGAGGFSYGFSQAGLRPLFGIDINRDACRTYQRNLHTPCHLIDIKTTPPRAIKNRMGRRRPFIVIGGPPCQGFSTAGLRGSQDPRNALIFHYGAIIREVAPRWFVFENVEGLLTSRGGQDVARLIQECVRGGYSVRIQKVNLAAYGVPQTRKRVLVIGNRLGMDFAFPPDSHSYDSGKARKVSSLPMAPTLAEAIAGLGPAVCAPKDQSPYASSEPVNAFDATMRAGHDFPWVTRHCQEARVSQRPQITHLKPGQTMKDLPPKLWHKSFAERANRRVSDGTPSDRRGGAPAGIKRLHGDRQAPTITGAATRELIHYQEHRPLTIRECARLQTFPDHYQWEGCHASVIQQIANAVPPLAARVLAHHIQDIDGRFGSGLVSVHQQKTPRLLGFVLTEAAGMSPALRHTQGLLEKLL